MSKLAAVDERARLIEHRLEWPMLVAALLTIPAIALEQSDVGALWDTDAGCVSIRSRSRSSF